VELPALIFGAMAHYGGDDPSRRVALMREAVQLGYRAFDTAPLYGFGESERRLGEALEGSDAIVATKVGLRWDGAHGDVLFATPTHTVRKDSRPESVREEIEQSLERLRRDRIDLVQIHHPDRHVPIDETMGALLDARRAGKVGAIGCSNFSPRQMRAAHEALGDVGLFSTQNRYSLVHREVEHAELPTARELGCAFLAYSPLAQGLLAGRMLGGRTISSDDWRASTPKFSEKNLAAIHAALEASLRPAAERHDATLAQVALAWLLAEPGVTSVIAGARTVDHARANLGALDIALSDGERQRIRDAFEEVRIVERRGRRERLKRLASRGLRRLFRTMRRE